MTAAGLRPNGAGKLQLPNVPGTPIVVLANRQGGQYSVAG